MKRVILLAFVLLLQTNLFASNTAKEIDFLSPNTACSGTANFTHTAGSGVCGNDLVVFTNTSNTDTSTSSFAWSFGDGSIAATQNTAHSYAAAGTYVVKLIVTNNVGCKDSISKNVIILAKSIAAFTINSTTQCVNNDNFIFSNASSGTVINNDWNFGDGTTSQAISPAKTYTNSGTFTVTLIVTNFSGCKDTVTKTVTVLPKPNAAFTITGSTGCTNNLAIGTNNTSSGTGLTYSWTFGDGNIASSTNPSNTYATSGTYDIRLIASSTNTCKDTITNQVIFKPKPTAGIALTGAIAQCSNTDIYKFNDVSSADATSFSWDFGNGTNSNSKNPASYSYATAGIYKVQHIVSNAAGCSDTVSTNVTVIISPDASFNLSFQGCNKVVDLSQINTANTATSFWNFGDNSAVQNNTPTTSHTYTGTGTFTVKLVAFTSGAVCKDSVTKTFVMSASPSASIGIGPGTRTINGDYCYNNGGNRYDLVSLTTGFGLTYLWTTSDGQSSTLSTAGFSFAAPGTYSYKYVVTNSNGCKDSVSIPGGITIKPNPVGAIRIGSGATGCTNNLTIGLDDSLSSANLKGNYTWNFGDGSATSNQPNPLKAYATQGNYTITLITSGTSTSGTAGCLDTATKVVQFFKLPSAGIDFAANHIQCSKNNIYGLLDVSANAVSRQWDFGDGFTPTSEIVTHSYANAGSYSIKLTAISSNACTDAVTENVTILQSADASFVTNNYAACNNLRVVFSRSVQQGSDNSTSNNRWSFSDGGVNTGTPSITHDFPSINTFTAKFIDFSNNGCPDSTQQTVTFRPNPVININNNQPITQCLTGNQYFFTDLSGFSDTRKWNFGEGRTGVGSQPSLFSYTTAGTYIVKEVATTSFGCQDSGTYTVNVLPSPLPAFTSTNQLCNSLNIQFIQNTTIPTNSAVWYFGDGTNSTTPYVSSHTYTTPGTYTVKYVVADAALTCKDSTTKTITLKTVAIAGFTLASGSFFRQCLNENSFQFVDTSKLAVSWLWDFGDGTTSTSQNPSAHHYSTFGNYDVTLTITDSTGCSVTSAPFTINVLVSPLAAFSFTGQTNCTTNLDLVFNNNSTKGSPFNSLPNTYRWDFGNGTTTSTSSTASINKTYPTQGTYTVSLIAENQIGCNDTTVQTITFSTPTIPAFTVNNNAQCVNNNHFIFTNNTVGAITNNWSFGDGTIASQVSPTHTYTTAGVYNAKLVITNATGCIDSISTTVTVNAKPSGAFTHTGGIGCTNNLTLAFTANTVGSTSYKWSFGDGTISSVANPTHSYLATGTYIVKLVEINANSCTDSTTESITFKTPPTAAFTVNNVAECVNGNNFIFTNNSIGAVSDVWSFGDGSATVPTLNTSHTYTTAGNYDVKLVTTSLNSCKDSIIKTMTVFAKPSPVFTTTGATSCTNNLTIGTVNSSTGAATYAWNFGDGGTDTATNPSHTYATIGNHIIKLVTTSINGCKDSATHTITFTAKPTAVFAINKDSQCVNGNSYAFTNTSLLAVSSVWNFGDGSATVSTPNSSHTYTTSGSYDVKLVITSADGCEDSMIQTVTVFAKPSPVFVTTGATSCTNNLTIGTVNSSTGAATYAWNFGDGGTDTATNPLHTYAAVGNHTIKLVTTSINGCKDSATHTITFTAKPTAVFAINKDSQCVNGNSYAFTNTSLLAVSSVWNFGDGSAIVSTPNASHTYPLAGIYDVKLVITSVDGCKDSITQTVTVFAKPSPVFITTGATSCTNNLTIGTVNSSTGAAVYAWNFGDGGTDTATNPSHTYATISTHIIKLVTTSINGCKDSATHTVTFTAKPTAAFTINKDSQCVNGNSYAFTNSSLLAVSSVWNFGDGSATVSTPNASHTYTSAGIYNVKLVITSLDGCKDSIIQTVTVFAKPNTSFTTVGATNCLNILIISTTNASTGGNNYTWDFGDGATDTATNASHSYTVFGTYTIKLVATSSNGCKDSTTRIIKYDSIPVASFNISKTTVCFGSGISFTNTSVGIAKSKWDFGDGTTDTTINATKTYSVSGTFNVKLVIVNANGCKDSITKSVTVVAVPTAIFTTTGTVNCTNNLTISTINSSINATSYDWSFGDGATDTATNPSHTYATTGTYQIKLVVTGVNGCKDSITHAVTFTAKPVASFNINNNNNSQCLSGNHFIFTNTSINGASQVWHFGDGTSDTSSNPTKTYLSTGNDTIKLIVTTINGCKDSATQVVTVNAMPQAKFATTGSRNCVNSFAVGTTNSSIGAVSYAWSFGDGNTDTATNPSHTYSAAGTYQIRLIVTNINGCEDSITKSVTFTAKPIASFNTNNNSQCLSGNHFIFTNTSIGGVSQVWRFGDGTSDTSSSPAKTYLSAGNDIVKLVVTTINGCKDSTTQVVAVNAMPQAKFVTTGSTNCVSSFVVGTTNSSIGAVSYAWSFGDGSTDTSTNPLHTYAVAGTYQIKLVVTNINGCKDSIIHPVTFTAKPIVSFSTNNSSQCLSGNHFIFTNTSIGGANQVWHFGDGTTDTASSPTKTYLSAGNYTVKLIVTTINGCKDSITKSVIVVAMPTAAYSINSTTQCVNSNSFIFTNTSVGAANVVWNFGDGTTDTATNATKAYTIAGSFIVKLLVTNSSGCKDSISKTITVIAKPIVAFSISGKTNCTSNFIINTNNNSTGAVNYTWSFGDGATDTATKPSHTYTSAGTYSIQLIATNANGCKDSTTQVVTFTASPTANYTVNKLVQCINNVIDFVDASTGAASYAWSFGDGTFSTTQNPTKQYLSTGTYIVKLVVTTINGCKDSVSKTITVVAKPTSSFTVSSFVSCTNASTSINFTNTSTGAVVNNWDFGNSAGSFSANPTNLYATQGSFVVTLIVTNANGCSDTSARTIVINPKPIAAFTTDITNICSKNTVSFTDNSLNTTTASYNWNFGDGTFSSLQNPTKSYLAAGSYTVHLLVTNASGCKDSIAKTITILPKPIASFSVNINNACADGYTAFLANSSTNAISYTWDFGDGSVLSNQASPTKTYSSTGTYIVTLIATNTSGCNDTLKRTVNIIGKPVADFAVNGSTQCLANNSFAFTNNSTGIISSYAWDFGDGTTSNLVNPTKSYIAFGSFTVKLTVVNTAGCSNTMSKVVVVASNPIASFNISNFNPCAAVNTVLFNNTSTAATTYTWDFGDGTTSNLVNPTNLYFAPGTYTVSLIAANTTGCISTTQHSITIANRPIAAFAVSSLSQCLTGNSFSFNNNSSGIAGNYVWDFGDGTTSTATNPTKSYLSSGTFTVKLTVNSANGCNSVATQTLIVTSKPLANFGVNNAIQCINGNQFIFTNITANQAGISFTWNFGDGNLSNQTNATKTYSAEGTYTVSLTATNANGCSDVVSKNIIVVGKPIASFTVSNNNQCINNAISFTNNTVAASNTVYTWRFGDGSISSQTNPAHIYANAGIYTATLVASNSGGCVDSSSQTIFISARPNASFTVVGNSQCSGSNTVSFINTSTGNIGSYLWSFSDGTVSTDFNPTITFANAGNYTAKLLIVSTGGCRDSVTKSFTVFNKLVASFKLSSVTQCINNNSFTFTNTTGLNSLLYKWDLGDGTFASTSVVTKSFLLSGTYNVKLVVINTATGCSDSVTNAVTVNAQPAASLVGSGTICQGNSFIINTNFAGIPPFSFTYNDGISNHFVSGINTVVYGLGVSPTTTTTYTIIAMNDAFCSASTADLASTSSTITVNNVAFIQQPANTTVCMGNSITLSSVATANTSFNYQWQKNGVDIFGANNSTLTLTNITALDAGTYSVAIVMPCGTVRSNAATLTVIAPATPPAFTPVVTLCQFDTATALVASGNNLSWYTTAVGGISSPVPPIPNTLFVGTQQYWVSNSNSVGCESQRYLITVNVLPAPTVSVAVLGNTTLLPGQTVTLTATASSNALGIRWYFNGQNIGSTPNNVLTIGFNGLGKYQAEAVTAQGCTARSAIVEVKPPAGLAPSYEGNNLKLYPNPITTFVNMYFDNPINQNATVRLVDVWGHELQTKVVKFTNRFQPVRMDVGNLTPGFYAVEISNEKGNTIARNLFVKVK